MIFEYNMGALLAGLVGMLDIFKLYETHSFFLLKNYTEHYFMTAQFHNFTFSMATYSF